MESRSIFGRRSVRRKNPKTGSPRRSKLLQTQLFPYRHARRSSARPNEQQPYARGATAEDFPQTECGAIAPEFSVLIRSNRNLQGNKSKDGKTGALFTRVSTLERSKWTG
jgi:hypothetical protein